MSIGSQCKQQRQIAQERSIANRILDKMNILRNSNSKNNARRWIWELLQNAKDVCNDKVKIKIDFNEEEKYLKFYHTGKPFNVESIVYLIEQVSTKERGSSKRDTTGCFGTGFLTTHLLSEVVQVDGIIEDESKFKKFSIKLDRSGRSIDEILKSLNESNQQLSSVDNDNIFIHLESDKFNTCFTYDLTENGVEVAKQGINDLLTSLPFSMMFVNKIESIYLSHINTIYSFKLIKEKEGVKIYEFVSNDSNKEIVQKYLLKEEDNISVSLPILESNNQLLKIKENCPRIFCDFPLIGTENFSIPFVVQSKNYNPTEPRDAIYLSDKQEDEIINNVNLMRKSLKVFYDLVDWLISKKFKKLCFLFDIPQNYNNESVDPAWIKKNIISVLEDGLMHCNIVENSNEEFIPILDCFDTKNVFLPYSKNAEIREGLFDLYTKINSEQLPLKNDLEDWNNVFCNCIPRLDFKKIYQGIEGYQNINDFKICLKLKNCNEVFDWLNKLILLSQKDEEAWELILNDKNKILYNQNGFLSKYSSLYQDFINNSELKDIVFQCDYDIRKDLLSKEFNFNSHKIEKNINDEYVVEEINKYLLNPNSKNKIEIAKNIISFYNENNKNKILEIQKILNRLFDDGIECKKINLETEVFWNEAEKILINRIVNSITEINCVDNLMQACHVEDKNAILKFLDSLIGFLVKNSQSVERTTIAILPNQNGKFCKKEQLFLDDGSIDNELKDIIALLGNDIREILLDKNIFLKMDNSKEVGERYVCEQIRSKIELFLQGRKDDMPWDAFEKLLVWFDKNKEKSKKFFGTLYENKHKLYNEDQIISKIEKATQLDSVFNEFNITDISQLRQMIVSQNRQEEPKLSWSEKVLTQYGISSQEEFEAFTQNKIYYDKFDHESKPDYKSFLFVKKLIQRSKDNVLKYLRKNRSEYNLEDVEELSTTILGGIIKNGQTISIVVRPADYDEVLIYYSSETNSLMYDVSELWIDDGKSEPRQLTLGEVFQNTGIKRIPLIRSK